MDDGMKIEGAGFADESMELRFADGFVSIEVESPWEGNGQRVGRRAACRLTPEQARAAAAFLIRAADSIEIDAHLDAYGAI